jgi:radical SAM superfamily enzyme YgiQ (UPF0313 family)
VGPPLGLAYLAAAAREAGHDVSILDANALMLDEEEAAVRACESSPDIVGITATTPTIGLAAGIAAGVKSRCPDVVTMVGGPHATALPALTLQANPSIDALSRGEAERSLAALLALLQAAAGQGSVPSETDDPVVLGRFRLSPTGLPAGFAFRRAAGSIMDTGIAPPNPDLDSLPQPARDLLPMDRYRCTDSDRFSTLLAVRGCPCTCVYCSVPAMFGKAVRYRSAKAVAAEMADVHERFGVAFFSFVDDTFTTDRAWVLEFCEHLHNRGLPGKARWICLTRADMVDRELLASMRMAGCVRVEMGIESGSDTGRKYLRKGLTEQAVLAGFRAAREAGLSTMGFAILNIPGETREDIEQTFDLVKRADPDYLQVSFLTPYPGTRLREEAQRNDWILTDDWARYSFLNDVILRNERFTSDEMQRIYMDFLKRFYYRPRTVWKLARLVIRGTASVRPLARSVILGLRATLAGKRGGA